MHTFTFLRGSVKIANFQNASLVLISKEVEALKCVIDLM